MSDRKRRPWTAEEDEILRKRIKSYGLNNWGMVADGLPGRSGKSCSERWRIYLTPGVKRPTQEPFNEYEVAVIYLGQQVHGNQWSAIAKLLPGRTNTAIKNLWKTALQSADAKRVMSNQYIQSGHSLETVLANPPSASEMAAAQRRKAAAAAARRRRAEAAAAAAAAASAAASPSTAECSGCCSEEDGGSMSDEGEEAAGVSAVSAGQCTAAAADTQEDPMQVDSPVADAADAAAAANSSAHAVLVKCEQAGSPGSGCSESNAPSACELPGSRAAATGNCSSAEREGRCSADGSSQDPQEGLKPTACDDMHPEGYGRLLGLEFFDAPCNESPLEDDQLGSSGWELSEPSDLLLPEREQEAAAAAAAASLGMPNVAAGTGADSCGEANSNSGHSVSAAQDAATAAAATAAADPAPAEPAHGQQGAAMAAAPAAVDDLAPAAAAAATDAAPAAAAAATPTAAPRVGGLQPGTGLRVLLPPGSIEAVQLPKLQPQQQQQQQAMQQQQQQGQVFAAAPVVSAGQGAMAAAMMSNATSQQQQMLTQQQQLQAQLMLQAWQQQQQIQVQMQHQQQQLAKQSRSASNSRRAQRKRPARVVFKRSDSDSDNDVEMDEAATRAAADAIASGAIKLNPNVHPAAAAAAAADAARAAARAAARKAASAAAANARKKNKAAAALVSEPDREVARHAAAAVASDADGEEEDADMYEIRQSRQRRRAAAGIAKVLAAEVDEATHLGLSPPGAPAHDDAGAAAGGVEVDMMQYSMAVPVSSTTAPEAAAAAAGAAAVGQSEYTMSYAPVHGSSMVQVSQGMDHQHHQQVQEQQLQQGAYQQQQGTQEWDMSHQSAMTAGPAAPSASTGMVPCPVSGSSMLDHFSDDPIMMELFKHEMSVAHALQQAPTSSGGPATTPTAAAAAAAVSPSFQPQGHMAQQRRVSAGAVSSPMPGAVSSAGMAASSSSAAGPAHAAGSSGRPVPPPAAGETYSHPAAAAAAAAAGVVLAGMDPAEAAATPRGLQAAAVPAGCSQAVTLGVSEASAATAAGAAMLSAPVQIQRQLSLVVPGTPAGAACSTADSEGSVFTASSRNSSAITSNRTAQPGGDCQGAVAGLVPGSSFVPQGQHAAGIGYYVTFTAPNGMRQQVLVQPAPAAAVPGAAPGTNTGGGFSGVQVQQQQQQMVMMAHGGSVSSMSMSMPVSSMGMNLMMPIGGPSAPAPAAPDSGCVSLMTSGSGHHMYGHCMGAGQQHPQQQQQQQHSNPVLAAMLSSNSDMSAHNPVLHATMAALSNQGSCSCVYCLTSGGRQQGMCRPQQGCIMGSAPAGACAGSSSGQQGGHGPTPAQLASWAMPPPRPVMLPQHPLAGKQAAAAAAAITAAAAGAGMTGILPSSSVSQGMSMGAMAMALGRAQHEMAPQLPVSMSAAAVEKAAEAAAAAAAAAAAVGGLVGSDDDEHDWGFDVVDLEGLDVAF